MDRIFTDKDVAKDVEAVCNKCGGDTWHTIVAVADGKIVQVVCNSCHSQHKFKPIAKSRMTQTKDTKSAVAVGTSERSAASATKKTTKSSGSTRSTRSSDPKVLVPRVTPNNREIQKYSIKAIEYKLGDRIEHPKFGLGIVDEILANDRKMYVTFETDRVMLVYGK